MRRQFGRRTYKVTYARQVCQILEARKLTIDYFNRILQGNNKAMRIFLIGILAVVLPSLLAAPADCAPDIRYSGSIDFDRDVRPILSENCFKCHGPDASQRMAGLRLDLVDGSHKKLDSGHAA